MPVTINRRPVEAIGADVHRSTTPGEPDTITLWARHPIGQYAGHTVARGTEAELLDLLTQARLAVVQARRTDRPELVGLSGDPVTG